MTYQYPTQPQPETPKTKSEPPKALVVTVAVVLFAVVVVCLGATLGSVLSSGNDSAEATIVESEEEFQPDEEGYMAEIRSSVLFDSLSNSEVLEMGYNACLSMDFYEGDLDEVLRLMEEDTESDPIIEGAILRVYRAAISHLCPQYRDSVKDL